MLVERSLPTEGKQHFTSRFVRISQYIVAQCCGAAHCCRRKVASCFNAERLLTFVSVFVTCAADSREQQDFYTKLYSVTNSPQTALYALLDKKEVLSQQLLQGMLLRLLGVQCLVSI